MRNIEGAPLMLPNDSTVARGDNGRRHWRLALGPSNLLVGYRAILPGDEHALHASERAGMSRSIEKVRRQSGAARSLARDLLKTFGYSDVIIPRSGSGMPLWPAGIVGSLAHDDVVTVAAVAGTEDFLAIGVDVEPAVPLPDGLVELVSTPGERHRYASDILESRLLFALKEAVYKTTFPVDHLFLEFADVDVDLASGIGLTRTGHRVNIAYTFHPRLVALAFLPRLPH